MNVLESTWRQLVRRKLWPVALLLVAALAAVPVLLSREADVPMAPVDPVPVTSEADDSIAEPIVAKVTAEDRTKRRRVLGARKDPFAPSPAAVRKALKDQPKDPKTEQDDETESKDPSGGVESKPDTGTGGGSVPVDTEPQPAPVLYEPGTVIVRFGEAEESAKLARGALKKGEPLPDDSFPLVVYMGLTKDGKKARFLVDASIEADGDGDCRPHPSVCETILLASGETEFLDVIDPEWTEDMDEDKRILASFQLDVVDIKRAGDDDVK